MNDVQSKQSSRLTQGLGLTVFIQVAILFLTSIILDAGEISRYCLSAITIHWIISAIIWLRHRHSPTKLDVFLFRGAYIPFLVAALIAYSLR